MGLFFASIILFSIMVDPPLLLAVPRDVIPEASRLKQFLVDENDDLNDMRNSATEAVVKRVECNGISADSNRRGDNDALTSLCHHLRERQTTEQFSQKNLANNQHDASNLDHLLWQHFYRQNFGPQLSYSSTKSSPLNPLIVNHANTLLNQETAQLNPIHVVNKPVTETKGASSSDNVFIDLLHNQPSNTGLNTNRFGFLPKISRPLFNSYLTGFASSVKEMTPSKNCALIVNMLPVLLINNFVNAITTINNLQLANSLMIPFVVLSVMNFITSFLFLDEYCPGSS